MRFWLMFIQSLPSVQPSQLVLAHPRPANSEKAELTFLPQTLPQTSLVSYSSSTQPAPAIAPVGSGMLIFPGIIGGLVLLLLCSVWAYTRIYVVTPNNEAFVRTGGVFQKQQSVILRGGCIVLPRFHELTRVPLREISIDVERTGKLAVRTRDYLRADMRVTFYVCITATEEDVRTAAARLSSQGKITPDNIKNALEKRADDAIRAAAKNKDLAEIDSDKLGFAQEVLNLVQQDLKKVGLTLNNIAISEIQESDTYDTNNFFDAQGVRLRTETIQRSIQQKREVELNTQVAIEQKELDAARRSLQIEQEKETARLEQQLQIQSLTAQQEREIQEAKAREASTAQCTQILQTQAVEMTEITRKKIVESSRLEAQVQVAESDRLSRLAQEDVAIAVANKKRESFVAEAQRAKAEAGVVTATEVEKAERSQRLAVIAAEKDAQEKRVLEQNVVEIDAFRRRRQAEVAQQAAELEAEAIRTLAIANREKALAEADGTRAQLEAKNLISDANLTANVISTIWPELAERLPEVLQALAPQPGVLGDARIYAFGGANGSNGNGAQDINKLLLSTSGLALINTLLDEGKLGMLLGQVGQLLHGNGQANGHVPLTPATQDTHLETASTPQSRPNQST